MTSRPSLTPTKRPALGDKAEIVIIDGGDNVTLEGNTMTAKGEGSVSFYCRYKTSLSNRSLYVCSDIVTLTTGRRRRGKQHGRFRELRNARYR